MGRDGEGCVHVVGCSVCALVIVAEGLGEFGAFRLGIGAGVARFLSLAFSEVWILHC